MDLAIYAIMMALISLCGAGVLDVLFKNFASNVGGRGFYVAGIGLVWGFAQFIYLLAGNQTLTINHATLLYGTLSGVVVALANILLIGSLKYINVSLGSTVYRLNTIGVVILSVIFLQEQINFLRALGVSLGIVAIILLYLPHRTESLLQKNAHISVSAFGLLQLILLASFLRALYGIFTKIGLTQGADANAILLFGAFFWFIFGLVYALIVGEDLQKNLKPKIYYVLVSSAVVFIIVNSLIEGLKYGDASLVIPIANMSFVLALLISVMRGMERLDLPKIIAVMLGAVAIIAISQSV
ncbi:MAG: DMT family transporter [Alphaproteobacteria bacterium]|nr:DMT family transporter [Alphaproteobacteria bacterium]